MLSPVLPGRLNELDLFNCWIENDPPTKLVVFHFLIEEQTAFCNYNMETRKWDVDLGESRFHNVTDNSIRTTVTTFDAKCMIRKVLTELRPKTASLIVGQRRWQHILQVYPAKVLTLKK